MSAGEPSLFELQDDAEVVVDPPARPEQLSRIRAAFEAKGILDVSTQRRLVQSGVVRELSGLHDLRASDVGPILRIIAAQTQASRQGGSEWDNRTEETWIDRM